MTELKSGIYYSIKRDQLFIINFIRYHNKFKFNKKGNIIKIDHYYLVTLENKERFYTKTLLTDDVINTLVYLGKL